MSMKPRKAKRPKDVAYTLLPPTSDVAKPMYEDLYRLVDAHHPELTNARIALAWCTSWKPDVDGRVTLGKCKKASDLDRELAPYDFVILLSQDFWQHPNVTTLQRTALLDHELMHATIAYDENGEPKVDARNRTVYRVRKHDLEEFSDVAARYGCWKRDIEAFMAAVQRAQSRDRTWVGYQGLRERLSAAGVDVPLERIQEWDDQQRREADDYAAMRRELSKGGALFDLTEPEHITAARTWAAEGDHA